MPKYPNGYIPASELVLIEGNHPATRGTAARWAALKADVLKNEGVTLRITGGENAYRSYAGQVFARKNACAAGRCNDAAVPGTSSHGGSLNGRDSGAIDVSNWAVLGKDKFYAYCRRNGFEPGYFSWEPWHIIDWDPYNAPSGGGGVGGDDMSVEDVYNARDKDGRNTLDQGRQIMADMAAQYQVLLERLDALPKAPLDALIPAMKPDGTPLTDAAGKPVQFRARDYLASTNAQVGALRAGTSASVDVNALAVELRKQLAPEIVKALGAALSNG